MLVLLRLLGALFGFLMLLVTVSFLVEPDPLLLAYETRWKEHPPARRAVVDALLRAEAETADTARLSVVERLVADMDSLGGFSERFRVRAYRLKGDVHRSLWQYVEARRAWRQALVLAKPAEAQALRDRLADLERIIESSNSERDKNTKYVAAPRVGPAGELRGRVVVAYVFVEDGGGGEWTLRTRQQALASWGAAEAWLARAAEGYGAAVEFTRRVFVVDRDPAIQRRTVGLAKDGRSEIGSEVSELVAHRLGDRHVRGLLERLRQEAGADQATLFLHLPRDARSFARRCLVGCGPTGEYAYIMKEARPRDWEQIEATQAHETLHLFGADDLYDIRDAKFYAPRDIMNYHSPLLALSRMEPVTGFAVGLVAGPVRAPFEIVVPR